MLVRRIMNAMFGCQRLVCRQNLRCYHFVVSPRKPAVGHVGLVTAGSHKAMPQQRCWRGAPVAVLVADAEATVEPVRGWVVERSLEGFCVELQEEGEVDPGTVLSIRVAGSSPMLPWVRVQVSRRQKVNGSWQLDCRYLRTPPWSIRMLFG